MLLSYRSLTNMAAFYAAVAFGLRVCRRVTEPQVDHKNNNSHLISLFLITHMEPFNLSIADFMWELIVAKETRIYSSHCYTWNYITWLRYHETALFLWQQHLRPTKRDCVIAEGVTKCILVEPYSLNSYHIVTPTVNSLDSKNVLKAWLQLYLHHVMAPITLSPHLLRIYLGTDEGCFSLERVEMACGHVVVVLLSV